MKHLLPLILAATAAACVTDVYQEAIDRMGERGGWSETPAGELSETVLGVCQLSDADRRHHYIDNIQRIANLRVNCLGDERYTLEKAMTAPLHTAVPQCIKPVAIPAVAQWVSSACEVEWSTPKFP